MKKSVLLFLVLIIALAFADDAEKPAEPGRETPPKEITHENAEDVLEELQGGKPDVFVVVFYVDQAEGDKVKGEIDEALKEDHPWIRTTTVDFTKVQDYYKLFKVLNLEGEPKRGHTAPQVLVMSKGEGFVIRGPNIADGIKKRIERVENGSLFGQGTSGKAGGAGYSFGGRR